MEKNIFDIVQEYDKLMFEIEANDGIIEDDVAEKLAIVEDQLEEKLRAYKYILDKNKSDIEYNKDEIARLRSRNSSRERESKYLRDRIVDALHLYGNQSKTNFNLKYPDFTVFTKATQSTEVETSTVDEILTKLINGGFDTLNDVEAKFIKDCGFILQDIGKIEVKVQFDVKILLDYIEEIGYLNGATAEFKVDKKALKELNSKAELLGEDIKKHFSEAWQNEIDITDRISKVMDFLDANFIQSETAVFK